MAQERLVLRPAGYALPTRSTISLFQPTGLAAPRITGPARVAIDWALAQPRFSLEDMIAAFDFVSEAAIRDAVAVAEQAGALKRIPPA